MSGSIDASGVDAALVAALRNGEEDAFKDITAKHYDSMLRVARLYVRDIQVAQEVVQDTWVAVLHGLNRFEGRSSFKTWLFTILTNRAKTRASREGRYVPLALDDEDDDEPSVAPHRFNSIAHPQGPRHWAVGCAPQSWNAIPESRLIAQETFQTIMHAIEALPPNQQTVIRLRDIEGLSAEEVCNILDITETNQRVLLHRARSRVRQALETYFAESPPH